MDFKIEKFLKNLKCAICHDVLIDATVTNCGHSFCEWCIKKWENEKFDILANGNEKLPKCPMCNTEFETLSSNHMLKNHIEEMCNLLLSEEDKSDRQKTMIQHSDNMSNLILSANEAIAEFEAALQLDVHPENGTNSQTREYARVCSLALRYERAANARGVGTGAPSVFTTAPETAPEELVYPPNSVNTVQIPIETIYMDMPRPDSTGQDTDMMSSNRHSQGHGSSRRAPRPRSSPYNLDDRHRNRG